MGASQIKPFFEGPTPLRVVVLYSGSASSARYLFARQQKSKTLKRKIRVVGAFCDRRGASGTAFFRKKHVLHSFLDKNSFLRKKKRKKFTPSMRERYFDQVLSFIKKTRADLLMLSGFFKILPPSFIKHAPPTLNVHPADLTITAKGRRAYTGAHAVHDALRAGEKEVRASVHLVTAEVDGGPLITLSRPVHVNKKKLNTVLSNPTDFDKFADALQEKLKWKGDGPAFVKALQLVADKKVATKNNHLYIKHGVRWSQRPLRLGA